MEQWTWIAVAVGVLVAAILLFNTVVRRRNQVDFAFASIDAQLKKRYDLVPNLVAACEKYMGYEDKLLRDLAGTRERMLQAPGDERMQLENRLSTQLRSVFALSENYPALRAADTFTTLQRSLNEVEEQLAAARRAFNAAVTDYNNTVQTFPTNLAAAAMGCRPRTLFEAAAQEREPVKVWR